MSKFLNALEKEQNFTQTTNRAVALKSTEDDVLNLFASCGALRNTNDIEIERKFSLAMNEDPSLAIKVLFYTRSIRESGLGERRTFKVALRYLANNYTELVKKNLHNVSFYGRWDDLLVLLDTKLRREAIEVLESQLKVDIDAIGQDKEVSLLAKWLPSENASSSKTKILARELAKEFGFSQREYRKTLSALRKKINVVETLISANKWNIVEYSKVPSQAMTKYRTAFYRHDEDRISKFLTKVEKGEAKINAGTLYPYDITEKFLGYRTATANEARVLNAQWDALPNYIDGEHNILVMADVSGSMMGRPLASAIGLAMYFAERNKGAYNNKFMTFSAIPELVTIKGNSLADRIHNINKAKWDMNTNLESAFETILKTSLDNKLSQEEMPRALVIISDMEMDNCVNSNGGRKMTFYDTMKNRYESFGYKIPNVVFWNVASRKDVFQVSKDCVGVQLVSGQSASTFKSVLNAIDMTPYQAMLKTLSDEYFDRVVTE